MVYILSSEETQKSNLQALARWGLRNSLSPKTGRGRYAMAEYEKIKRITIPLRNDRTLTRHNGSRSKSHKDYREYPEIR